MFVYFFLHAVSFSIFSTNYTRMDIYSMNQLINYCAKNVIAIWLIDLSKEHARIRNVATKMLVVINVMGVEN